MEDAGTRGSRAVLVSVHLVDEQFGDAAASKDPRGLQANESAIDDNSVRFPTLAQLAQVKQMAPEDLRERVLAGSGPILLDVREPEEFVGELGHLAGASLIRLQYLSDRSKELEQFKHLRSSRSVGPVCVPPLQC